MTNRHRFAIVMLLATMLPVGSASAQVTVMGNVYGGGNLADVQANTAVNMSAGAVKGNVYGGGKGEESTFECAKAMVGINNEGAGADLDSDDNKNKGTIVTISNGTVGTLEGEGGAQTLKAGTGNVYGGGEIGRVEWNTQVRIGVGTGEDTFEPEIYGSVFGAGKGLETHGYSALVRGNSTVTIQGDAKVGYNVYGGGEKATVGRYWVKGVNNIDSNGDPVVGAPTAPTDLPVGMPYQQQSGGICRVTIQGNAEIGYNGATDSKGHVFGAGKGVEPHFVESGEGQSQKMTNANVLVGFTGDGTKTAKDEYLDFLQSLSLATNSYVTIDGAAQVKGSIFGGSESGFVQHNTSVTIQGSSCEIGTTTYGNVFGGGKGLATFAEAGKVKGNATVAISAGTVKGNVYGGGNLGDVGIIDKTDKKDGQLTYNYTWKQNDGTTANVANHNTNATATNTGICTVTVTGGEIGSSGTPSTEHGNVFGAGRGSSETWWCEKAIAYATDVNVSAGTVHGNVYGGGEVGRVEDDAKVVIGVADATEGSAPTISGSVYGAGAGLATHGYSALVRGNSDVTVQGTALVGGNVFGGGEIASVGRFTVVGGLPKHPDSGGNCTVTIQDHAKIGKSGTGYDVYGACKGVNPADIKISDRKSMQLLTNAPANTSLWDHYNNDENSPFIWRYYATEADYLAFLKTLALTSHPHVTISEDATVNGSVFGGGQRGVTLGNVVVDITGGTIEEDVYGGGALADTNLGNWDADGFTEVAGLTAGESSVAGLYERSGAGTTASPYSYTETADEKANGSTTYYSKGKWTDETKKTTLYTTTVNLLGGQLRDAYGGGLGDATTPAYVYGDTSVELNNNNNGETADGTKKGCSLQRIFGCNNVNGTPKGSAKVHVYATQHAGKSQIANTPASDEGEEAVAAVEDAKTGGNYDVAAVYGGGNQAAYEPVNALSDNEATKATATTNVIIDGCHLTSINQVYGGGNAASTPATNVTVNGTYEIYELFGGGNGKDPITVNGVSKENPGANVGFYDYSAVESTYNTKEERQTEAFTSKYVYGSGKAAVNVFGGTVHRAFGGSNTKGNVRMTAVTMLEDVEGCEFNVDEAYGGGKSAPMDAEAKLLMACIPGLNAAYGGAEAADIQGDVTLNITNGTFDRVFGGNNISGTIRGSITVNIEETGCKPVVIGELYGGGNLAGYSVYGYKQVTEGTTKVWKPRESATDTGEVNDALSTHYRDPEVNVKSFTSIGNIFGGGFGKTAVMVGNPHVNINEVVGEPATYPTTGDFEETGDGDSKTQRYKGKVKTMDEGTANEHTVTLPSHIKGQIGAIQNVFGGGNAAKVIGDTYVNIGTKMGDQIEMVTKAKVNTGTNDNPVMAYPKQEVKGADIRGNVYGGGNAADVTGKTNVQIGKQ